MFTALTVVGHGDAVVAHPSEGSGPYPLVVALHGNFDRPEWICDVWRRVSRASAFVLCPRGSKRSETPESDARFTYDSALATEKEVGAARDSFDGLHGADVDRARVVLVGFSLGGVHAALLAVRHPDEYHRVVLIEGGDKPWSPAAARKFQLAGGRAVFVCAQSWCEKRFGLVARWFAPENVRAATALGAGHTYDGRVADVSAEHWAFITEPTTAARNE